MKILLILFIQINIYIYIYEKYNTFQLFYINKKNLS